MFDSGLWLCGRQLPQWPCCPDPYIPSITELYAIVFIGWQSLHRYQHKKTNGSKCPIHLNLHKIVKKDQDLHQQSVRGLRLASTLPHTRFDPKGCFKQQLKPSDWDGMTPFCRRKAPDLPTHTQIYQHTHTHNLSGRTRARAICRHSVSVYWQLAV